MKKSLKLLCLLLSLFIVAAAVAVVAGAEEDSSPYKVGGVGYADWASAYSAAIDSGKTVYLNQDIEINSSYKISGNITFDLNGHTISDKRENHKSANYSTVFEIAQGANFRLVGEGKILNTGRIVDAKGANVEISGYGAGIEVSHVGAAGGYVINLSEGAKLTMTGDVRIDVAKHGTYMIYADKNCELVCDGLRFYSGHPTDSYQRWNASSAVYFIYLVDNTKVTVKNNSKIELLHGNLFYVRGTAVTYGVDRDSNGNINPTGSKTTAMDVKDPVIFINVTDSTLIASEGGFKKTVYANALGWTGAGRLFSVASSAAEVRITNSTISAANRAIGDTNNKGKDLVNAAHFYFKNVDMTYTEATYGSPWVTDENVNLYWDGGSIHYASPVTIKHVTLTKDEMTAAFAAYYDAHPTETEILYTDLNWVDEKSWFHPAFKYAASTKGYTLTDDAFTDTDTRFIVDGDGNYGIWEYRASNDSAASLGGRSHKYTEVTTSSGKKTWFGLGFEDVVFTTSKAPNASKETNATTNPTYLIIGKSVSNYQRLVNGEIKTYITAFVNDDLPVWNTNTSAGNYTGVNFVRTGSADYTSGTNSGTAKHKNFVWYTEMGTVSEVYDEASKNGYVKHVFSATDNGSNDYGGITAGSVDNVTTYVDKDGTTVYKSNGSSGVITGFKDYTYIVQEFDFGTLDRYPGGYLRFSIQARNWKYDYDANGKITAKVDTRNYGPFGTLDIYIYPDGSFLYDGTNYGKIDTTPGVWHRLSYVYEIHRSELRNGEITSGSGKTKAVRDYYDYAGSMLHLYLDGKLVKSIDLFKHSGAMTSKVDADFDHSLCFESVRISYQTKGTVSSYMVDNNRTTMYKCEDLGMYKNGKLIESIIGHPELMQMPNNNPLSTEVKTAIASVNGKDVYDTEMLFEAMTPGSVVELYADITDVMRVPDQIKIITNGHKISSHVSENCVKREYDGIINFAWASESEQVKVIYREEAFGTNVETKAALGSLIDTGAYLSSGDFIVGEYSYTAITSWKTPNGETQVSEGMLGTTLVLTPEYLRELLGYSISIGDKTEYVYAKDASGLITKLNSYNTQTDITIVVVVLSNITTTEHSTVTLPKGSALYFDLNGNTVVFSAYNKKPVSFTGTSGSSFYLYSSKEGGTFINTSAQGNGTTSASIVGSPVWYQGWDPRSNTPEAHAYFGAVKNDALGIDAKGDNLTVAAATIADFYGPYLNKATEENGYTDVDGDGILDYNGQSSVSVDGGTYIRYCGDGIGMFAARGSFRIDIKNATIVGDGPLFATDSRFYRPEMKLTIDNSTIIVSSSNLTNTSVVNMFSEFHEGSEALITNSSIAAGFVTSSSTRNFALADGSSNAANFGGHDETYSAARKLAAAKGKVTIGKGTALISDYGISESGSSTLGEGLIMANAKYKASAAYKLPNISFEFTVDGSTDPVRVSYAEKKTVSGNITAASVVSALCSEAIAYTRELGIAFYVDTAENLALIKWYNTDGTLIGESYNAPVGEAVDANNYSQNVTPTTANEWYRVAFTKWNCELAKGEASATPVCETPVADVRVLKINVTVYTYFQINFYLPKNVGIEGFRLIGISTDPDGENVLPSEDANIGGKEQIMFKANPGAANAELTTRYIVFEVNGEKYVQSFDFGIPTYAAYVLQGEYDEDAKSLVSNMVRYANECHKLAYGEENALYAALLERFATGLCDYSEISFSQDELEVDWSRLSSVISDASFMFGSYQPRFAFKYRSDDGVKLPISADGNIGEWPDGNKGVFTNIYYTGLNGDNVSYLASHLAIDGDVDKTELAVNEGKWDNAGAVYAMTNDLFVYDAREIINIVVYQADGTVLRGTYSLAAYISSLTEGTDAYNAAMSLYAFSISAENYRGK